MDTFGYKNPATKKPRQYTPTSHHIQAVHEELNPSFSIRQIGIAPSDKTP